MRNILDSDNVGMSFLTTLGNLIILNFIFIIGCVPIITIGASLSATLTVNMKIIEGKQTDIVVTYLKAFKNNFKQATIIWILNILAAIVVASDVYFAFTYTTGALRILILVLAIFMMIIMLLTFTFAYPIQARYNNTIFKHVINGFVVSGSHIFWTFLVWLIWIFPILLTYFYDWIFKYFGFLWLLCGFSGLLLLSSNIFLKVLKSINNLK